KPRLLDQVRDAIRLRHYSPRTESAYVAWIREVAASTQNQALSAVLFLYEAVLGIRLPGMTEVVRAQRPIRLPVVLSREEVSSLLLELRGVVSLMASLMYGAGLRLLECA